MRENPDGSLTIQWLAGVSHISHEQQIRDGAIVFGYRLNGGDFQETSRMTFGSPKELGRGLKALSDVLGR